MANPFSNTVKFLKAVNLLASQKGMTVKGLSESLGISRRSVFRLLQALEELGFPLIDASSRSKRDYRYRLADSYVLKLPNMSVPNVSLTNDEIIFVLSLLDTCKQYNLLCDTRLLNSIKEKFTAMLPDKKKG
jgi:predicted DNA-binding transcriptional regulator YafY